MADSEQDEDSNSSNEFDQPEPLGAWERASAMAIGVICGGAGGYAVYEKSNQAGTATLLILAAIFLLIGIQGTPLIKFGSNSGSLELERRRKKGVAQALEKASKEASTEKAEGIVEAVRLVAPDLVPRGYEYASNYERAIANTLISMGYDVLGEPEVLSPHYRPDFAITKNGRTVYADVRYHTRPIPASTVRELIGLSVIASKPVLLIASGALSASGQALLSGRIVDFVQWRDNRDDPELRSALERLLSADESP